uniref:Uncharacterized protein AlNc14C18G1867 n=1 Tax=Albugo laibachii Nc14 TaxID=890382 RepID=F0W4P6_9STRA|nr:conserved hypothetical protein [Albugo laibachii Nc14]|eukprot:CCA16080.1 conserved hypothetical protein [Albugo laibachii Nc14]
MPPGDTIYGSGAVVNSTTGKVISAGNVSESLILEYQDFAAPRITTMAFAILAAEIVGYKISFYATSNTLNISNRLQVNLPRAQCTPTHANLAVPSEIETYNRMIGNAGSTGYYQTQGFYTIKNFVQDGMNSSKFTPTFTADFWRDYIKSEPLIHTLRASLFFNSRFYPPSSTFCANGTLGCLNHCSKSYACSLRESQNLECLVVIMISYETAFGFPSALAANLGIPAYFCYIGRPSMDLYILDAWRNRRGALFYRREPATVYYQYPNVFTRVAFPYTDPAKIAQNTWNFGENGYGNETNNPVDVEYPVDSLQKRYATVLFTEIEGNTQVFSMLYGYKVSDFQMYNQMNFFVNLTNVTATAPPDGIFSASCKWVRENYEYWAGWVPNLPLCTMDEHMYFTVSGCDNSSNATSSPHVIEFFWRQPYPENDSTPYNCDGGLAQLPSDLVTSRSCIWIKSNEAVWRSWIIKPPVCDLTHLTYNVSTCRKDIHREVSLYWKAPSANDSSISRECVGGYTLPQREILLDCEYIPTSSTLAISIFVVSCIVMVLIFGGMIIVFLKRKTLILRRSQPEFIATMLLGGALICLAVIAYAGKPSPVYCATRPVLLSFGFTSIFGSLMLKSMRVYRIFLARSLKRVVLKTNTMFQMLGTIYLVDIGIFASWFSTDIPDPASVKDSSLSISTSEEETSLSLPVWELTCESGNPIFVSLLMFSKAILLCTGLYLSFKIRKVSTDFQESIWIFASSVVVVFATVLVFPMAYFFPVSAKTFYLIFSVCLLLSTIAIIGMMLVPKLTKANDPVQKYTSGESVVPSQAECTEAENPNQTKSAK